MKYRLLYTNEFGQVVKPDGTIDLSGVAGESYSEEYVDIKEAKLIAKKFVENYPLMACVISPGENGESELIVSADNPDIERALKAKETDIEKTLKKVKQKKLHYLGFLILLLFVLLIFLSI